MDILEEHFPQLLPPELESDQAFAPVPTHIETDEICDPGIATDETFVPELVGPCDDAHLRSLWQRLHKIMYHIMLGESFCALFEDGAVVVGDDEVATLLQFAINQKQQTLFDLRELKQEFLRLKLHPKLFESAAKASVFWKETSKMLKLAKKQAQTLEHLDEFLRDCRRRAHDTVAVQPNRPLAINILPDTSGETRPWQTWCRQIPVQDNTAAVKALRDKHRDMQLTTTQLLPIQGVLIAEHWRRKVEAMVLDIVSQSPNPALAQTQIPRPFKLTAHNRHVPGLYAVVKEPSRAPNRTPQMEAQFAFGPQTWEASVARLMAYMEQDITSRGDKQAMFMGTFQTPQGKKIRLDPNAWETEQASLYQSRRA